MKASTKSCEPPNGTTACYPV